MQILILLSNPKSCPQNSHNNILCEIQSLRTSITTPDSANHLSYVEVARTSLTSQPSNIQTLSSFNIIPITFTDTLYCIIDILKMIGHESNTTSTSLIRVAVKKGIRIIENYMNWRCRAITVDPKNAN
jgi:hypothetical protein